MSANEMVGNFPYCFYHNKGEKLIELFSSSDTHIILFELFVKY